MNEEGLISELQLKAVRSSGPGGQHVNKVSTKIELSFDLSNSNYLEEEDKTYLIDKLGSRLSKEGFLKLQCDESRSQHRNKEIIIDRFLKLLKKALEKPKKRKSTKTPKKAVEKRLEIKRQIKEKKAGRKKPELD